MEPGLEGPEGASLLHCSGSPSPSRLGASTFSGVGVGVASGTPSAAGRAAGREVGASAPSVSSETSARCATRPGSGYGLASGAGGGPVGAGASATSRAGTPEEETAGRVTGGRAIERALVSGASPRSGDLCTTGA
ncbi:MAG TPA: hypothetical protein VKL22_01555 [Actinomycetota bacterium]|nr:hypothetical protein [Actinomycetota bacterium]